MTPPVFHQFDRIEELRSGVDTPWGSLKAIETWSPGLANVWGAFGGGVFVEIGRRHQLDDVVSPHGQAWWSWNAGVPATSLAFGLGEDMNRSHWIARLYGERPDWLDALAARCGVANSAQVRTIFALHERFGLGGIPDFRLFARERETGMVHGWIGSKLFVGIELCGRAHS